jgi:hypothetical protein
MRSPKAAFDLRAALTEEVRAAELELDAAASDPSALHRCRVRLKRAKALARVGRACAPGLSAVFNDSARVIMRTLAQPRTLTAMADAARMCASTAKRRLKAALTTTAENLDAERQSLPELDVETTRARLKDLLALAQVWPEASSRQIRKGARRIERRARCARARGRCADDPARRHEWRKREKDRHFAALLLGNAWPGRRRRKLTARLGDVLGEERDTLLLSQRLAADTAVAGDPEQARRALKALARRRARLARRADALGAKLRQHAA